MAEEEPQVTIEEQFLSFAKLYDHKRDGSTINLYRSDYWLRQAHLLDDRNLTMTDTGIAFQKFRKTELTLAEWLEYLTDICELKGLDKAEVEVALENCGVAGEVNVDVPQYRHFFDTYRSKKELLNY